MTRQLKHVFRVVSKDHNGYKLWCEYCHKIFYSESKKTSELCEVRNNCNKNKTRVYRPFCDAGWWMNQF